MAVQVKNETVPDTNAQAKTAIKILAVDDREDNLFSIETILEKDGYAVHKALSGRAALKVLLNQHDFTLILMDVQMPGMNGFETASLIYERDKLKHIPIIFITAHGADEANMFKGYQTGGVDFIYKPLNPELLRLKVGVFADLYRKNHQLLLHERSLKEMNRDLQREIEERRSSEEKVNRLNQQLLESNEELKTINQELDRFAYLASHDLQEPLRKIMLFVDKLSIKLHDNTDSDVKDALGRILRASERMQTLINDLLKLSRHAEQEDDFMPTDLNQVLRDVVSELESEIKNQNGSVTFTNLPSIQAIPGQVFQLFQNLISNALKFCKAETAPEVHIYSENLQTNLSVQGPNGRLPAGYRIYVRDNGIGFDPKYAEEIFLVFKRLHSYQEIKGTGIGLSICKKIVERHGGTIAAQSRPHAGSTFIITLPQREPA